MNLWGTAVFNHSTYNPDRSRMMHLLVSILFKWVVMLGFSKSTYCWLSGVILSPYSDPLSWSTLPPSDQIMKHNIYHVINILQNNIGKSILSTTFVTYRKQWQEIQPRSTANVFYIPKIFWRPLWIPSCHRSGHENVTLYPACRHCNWWEHKKRSWVLMKTCYDDISTTGMCLDFALRLCIWSLEGRSTHVIDIFFTTLRS